MILELPDPWGAYMRLQSDLDATTQVNSRSWGLEAGLDAILAAPARDGATLAADLSTAIATASRRERDRARRRRTFQLDLERPVDQPAVIEARVELAQLRRHLPAVDWQIVRSRAEGMDYQAIARHVGGTPGGLKSAHYAPAKPSCGWSHKNHAHRGDGDGPKGRLYLPC